MNEIDTNDIFFDTEKKNQSDLGLKVIHQKPNNKYKFCYHCHVIRRI
jgi:hypothetical protein